MIERIAIDTTCHHVMEETSAGPGDSGTLRYTDARVQDPARLAFGDLLPAIRLPEGGLPYYENFDEESRETCCLSRHASSYQEIPADEVMRLAEGWHRLLRMAKDHSLPPSLRKLIQGFQLPNPVTEPQLYRLYPDNNGRTRLHVFWGFTEPDGRSAPMPASQVVGFLLARIARSPVPVPVATPGGGSEIRPSVPPPAGRASCRSGRPRLAALAHRSALFLFGFSHMRTILGR